MPWYPPRYFSGTGCAALKLMGGCRDTIEPLLGALLTGDGVRHAASTLKSIRRKAPSWLDGMREGDASLLDQDMGHPEKRGSTWLSLGELTCQVEIQA